MSDSSFCSAVAGNVTLDSLEQLSGPQLQAVYQELTGKTVGRFRDRASGIAKVKPVLESKLEEVKRVSAPPPPPVVGKKGRKKFNYPFTGKIRSYREGTKRAALIEVLQGGATFDHCMVATGWSYKVCYENIWLLHFFVGFGLSEGDDGVIRLVQA